MRSDQAATSAMPSPQATLLMRSPHFEEAANTVIGRCSMCHTAEPDFMGVREAPKNVILDNEVAVANYGEQVAMQAGFSHAMPPGNLSFMEPQERQAIVYWFRAAGQG